MEQVKSNVTIWIIIILLLIGGGYALGFLAYNDYEEGLSDQSRLTMDKFEELDKGLKEFSLTFEDTLDKNRIARGEVASQIGSLKEDFQVLKNAYKNAVLELRETVRHMEINRLTRKIENLQEDINKFRVEMQDLDLKVNEVRGGGPHPADVDLGKISVGK